MMRIANWMRGLILTLVLNGGIKPDDAMPHQHSEVHLVTSDIANVRKGGPGTTPLPVIAEFITNYIVPRRIFPHALFAPAVTCPW
jgi:hypothetical protein